MVMPTADTVASAESSPDGLPAATPPEPADAQAPAGDAGATGTSDEGGDPGAGDGGIGADGGDGAGEQAPPAWHEARSLQEVVELPEFKTHIDGAVAAGRKEGLSDAQSRMQPFLEKAEIRIGNIDANTQAFVTSWNKHVKDGTLSPEAVQELLGNNQAAFVALSGMQQDTGIWMGLQNTITQIGKQIGSDALARDFALRAQKMRTGLTDPTFYPDLVEAISDAATKPLRGELEEAKATIARHGEQDGDTKRDVNGQRPARAAGRAGGAGGGLSPDEYDKRLDRLTVGRDADGNLPTQADRDWIASQGN